MYIHLTINIHTQILYVYVCELAMNDAYISPIPNKKEKEDKFRVTDDDVYPHGVLFVRYIWSCL